MSLQSVLQQLLHSAQQAIQSSNAPQKNQQTDSSSPLSGFTGGALTGGALALLLGNKRFRKMGGKVASYGSIAALGAVAYRAYDEWNKNKESLPTRLSSTPADIVISESASELENHSRLVLTAMISAAKADGHINAEEQALLDNEFQKLEASESEKQWLSSQLTGPADPAAVALLVSTPEQGAEVYLASVLITGADSFMERAYLDELARQLNLDNGLKEHLEKTVLDVGIENQ